MAPHSVELLAPAGNVQCFRAALAAGADAIYCAMGSDLNARRGADNLDEAQFRALCREAHVAGVRVYAPINVVVQQSELEGALDLVGRTWAAGADGIIVQDWGLMALIDREMPEVEVHVSTQAAIQDARGADWCRRFGVSRVTLARELTLGEIRTIADACGSWGAEVECFCHGAICFSYSGLCMMSAMRGDRSANRGLCAQPCRLPHILEDERGTRLSGEDRDRALCPRDYRLLEHLSEMVDAGVGSLKIEGRMKSPDYVWAVVGAYRRALDAVIQGRELDGHEAREVDRALSRAFNRDFTDGYLEGFSDNRMMSYGRSNNRGQLAGEVIQCRGDQVTIRCDEPVAKGDLLELRPERDPERFLTLTSPRDVPAAGVLKAPIPRFVTAGTPMRVLRSQAHLDGASRIQGRQWVRQRPVRVAVRCVLGEPLSITMATTDGAASVTVEGQAVEAARTRPLTREAIAEHVGRMGAGPFEPTSIEVELEGDCGMGFSTLHHLREDAVEALVGRLLAPYERTFRGPVGFEEEPGSREAGPEPREVAPEAQTQVEVCVLAPTLDLARLAREGGADRVYLGGDGLRETTSEELAREGIIPWLDEICRESDHGDIDPWVREGGACAVGNVSELALAAERGAAAEVRGCIPVHNRAARDVLIEAGAQGFWLSPELSLAQIGRVAQGSPVPMGVQVLGRTRTMTSEHCVLQVAGRCRRDCEGCELRQRSLHLTNVDGLHLPVTTDSKGRSRIFWARVTDLVPEVADLLERGVTRLLIDATTLPAEGLAEYQARLVEAIACAREGRPGPRRLPGADRGHIDGGVR